MLPQIRAKQEQQLKVRNFLPPQSQEPEIFLLNKTGGPGFVDQTGGIFPRLAFPDDPAFLEGDFEREYAFDADDTEHEQRTVKTRSDNNK